MCRAMSRAAGIVKRGFSFPTKPFIVAWKYRIFLVIFYICQQVGTLRGLFLFEIHDYKGLRTLRALVGRLCLARLRRCWFVEWPWNFRLAPRSLLVRCMIPRWV